jgi:hypothetical protein
MLLTLYRDLQEYPQLDSIKINRIFIIFLEDEELLHYQQLTFTLIHLFKVRNSKVS